MASNNNEAQQRFDKAYISSSEVQKELSITRATILYARRRGDLPDPIVINDGNLFIWEREPLQPYLEKWRRSLCSRRRAKS